MKINKDAWHYKFYRWYATMRRDVGRERVSNGGSYDRYFDNFLYMPHDFCTYWRGVILWPLVNLIINIVIFGGVIVASIFSVVNSGYILVGFAAIGFLIAAIVVAISLIGGYLSKIARKSNTIFKDDNFVAQIYKSNKDKICPVIEYEKGE
jgi:hypothetical protein